MNNKTSVMLVLASLLLTSLINFSAAASYGNYDPAVAIKDDGSVQGTDRIQRSGNVYTLTGDIAITEQYCPAGIQVLKDNVVIDGAGFSVKTNGSAWMGIDLSQRSNVLIKNLKIKGFQQGIFLNNSTRNTVEGNEIVGFSGPPPYGVPTGIWVGPSSSYNRIVSNNISSNIEYGILVESESGGNYIESNIVRDNGVGIDLSYSPGNILRNNRMIGNNGSLELGYNSYAQFIQDIDNSNTIDGKPVYYWIDQHNKTVPANAAFVAIANSTNIIVRDLLISRSMDSITLINTNNSVITNNRIEKNGNGIFLKYSQNISITNNSILSNRYSGVGMIASSNITIMDNIIDSSGFGISTAGQTNAHAGGRGSTNVVIYRNDITNNDPGIYLSLSQNITASTNLFSKNTYGINLISSSTIDIVENTFLENNNGAVRISGAYNNTFYHNNFINNSSPGSQVFNPWIVLGNPEDNIWDNGFEGNYWNDFQQRYPNASEVAGSGVWNMPYYINEKNIDRYPLVNPYKPRTQVQEEDSLQNVFSDWSIVPVAVASVATVAVISVGLLVYFKKRKRKC